MNLNTIIYCEECETTRNITQKYCPTCSWTEPRFSVKFRSTAGTYFVHDRWASKDLAPDEIVTLLNSASFAKPY
jgi:hypothetical protein